MKLEWFADKITDELADSEYYIKYAMDIKAEDSDLSKAMIKMAEDEKNHAETLYNSAEAYYKALITAYTVMPEHIKSCMANLKTTFTECNACINKLFSEYEK